MIELGCCSYALRMPDLESSLRLTHDLGFRHVDVGATSPEGKRDIGQREVVNSPLEIAKRLCTLAEKYELELEELFVLRIHVHGHRVDVNDPNPRLRERAIEAFRGLAEFAAEASFKSIMLVPGPLQEELGSVDSLRISVESLTKLQSIIAQYDVRLHVEPHGGSIAESPEGALRLIEAVPGMGYTLDYSHFVAQGIPQNRVTPLHNYAGHMHARQGRRGEMACPVEEGEIDYGSIIKGLKIEGWDGVISVEYGVQSKDSSIRMNPVFQNVMMAYRLDQLIDQL